MVWVYIGTNEDRLYKVIMVFIINGLKKTIPSSIKAACPEVTVNGK